MSIEKSKEPSVLHKLFTRIRSLTIFSTLFLVFQTNSMLIDLRNGEVQKPIIHTKNLLMTTFKEKWSLEILKQH